MNNTELTFSYAEQIFAFATLIRRVRMTREIESLIAGTDNEIVKSVYQGALQMIKEGWPC